MSAWVCLAAPYVLTLMFSRGTDPQKHELTQTLTTDWLRQILACHWYGPHRQTVFVLVSGVIITGSLNSGVGERFP